MNYGISLKEKNVHIIGVPEGKESARERERSTKLLEGIMAKNFPNFGSHLDIHFIKPIDHLKLSTQNDLLQHIL